MLAQSCWAYPLMLCLPSHAVRAQSCCACPLMLCVPSRAALAQSCCAYPLMLCWPTHAQSQASTVSVIDQHLSRFDEGHLESALAARTTTQLTPCRNITCKNSEFVAACAARKAEAAFYVGTSISQTCISQTQAFWFNNQLSILP